MTSIAYTLIGGPTFLIEVGGARIVVDPTFDEPQTYTGPGVGRAEAFIKTRGPALTVNEILPIDVVLVTHDQHIDHLDHAGRAMLAHVPRVFTTHEGAERLGGVAVGLGEFEVAEVVTPTSELMVMGVRAQHGPEPLWRGAGACNGSSYEVTRFPPSTSVATTIRSRLRKRSRPGPRRLMSPSFLAEVHDSTRSLMARSSPCPTRTPYALQGCWTLNSSSRPIPRGGDTSRRLLVRWSPRLSKPGSPNA